MLYHFIILNFRDDFPWDFPKNIMVLPWKSPPFLGTSPAATFGPLQGAIARHGVQALCNATAPGMAIMFGEQGPSAEAQ